MEGVHLIEPTDVFNILNQEMTYPMLSDPCYLLLCDVRSLSQYREDHILTAKLIRKDENGEYQIPVDAELETKRNIVLYDEKTSHILSEDSPAITFAKYLWDNGSKYPVKVIKVPKTGLKLRETLKQPRGFQEFSALYPFLRTQEMIYTPQQLDNLLTYPVEVIPQFLYAGNHKQSQTGKVNKDLKVKAHINVSKKPDGLFGGRLEIPGRDKQPVPVLLEISVDDKKGEDLLSHFADACSFIDSHDTNDGKSVLVSSDLGICRSIVVVMAYLMRIKRWPLQVAWNHMKKCKSNMCPNRSFVEQLSSWEEQLFDKKISDINTIEPH